MITSLLKAAWIRWKVIAHKFGDFQARVLLFAFYFVVLAPFALVCKLCSDPLQLHSGGTGGWSPRPTVEGDVSGQAKRQF